MFKIIKILSVAAVMVMVFTASTHAFLGFGDSDEWKQMDILAKKKLASVGPAYNLINIEIKEFDRVEEKEIEVSDGLWMIYVAAYDITLTSGEHPPIRVVMYYLGATESKLVDGKLDTSNVSYIEYAYSGAATNENEYNDLEGWLEEYKGWIKEERGFGVIIEELSEHEFN